MAKRPRGLWRSQKSTGHGSMSPSSPSFGLEEYDDDDDAAGAGISRKRPRHNDGRRDDEMGSPHRGSSLSPDNSTLQIREKSIIDIEDWEDLKELFANAIERYEDDVLAEAVELIRGVVHESNRLLRLHPDPSVLFAPSHRTSTPSVSSNSLLSPRHRPLSRSPGPFTPPSDSERRDGYFQRSPSPTPSAHSSLPSSFHYIYGTSLFLLGKILETNVNLAKEGEPTNRGIAAFYLAALDVFEAGENIPSDRRPGGREDWRMAITWGRTLVSLADERQRRLSDEEKSQENVGIGHAGTSDIIDFHAPLWPKDSAFATSSAKRPPMTRGISLPGRSPHEILLQAADQFSRGMLHMPHSRKHHTTDTSVLGLVSNSGDSDESATVHAATIDSPPTLPGLGSLPNTKPGSTIRPRVLYTIASDVMSVAERIPDREIREYWAKWSDGVFLQMELEEQGHRQSQVQQGGRGWDYSIAVGRGRCWLIIGASSVETVEDRLEDAKIDEVLKSEEVRDARNALLKSIEHLERARGILKTVTPPSPLGHIDPFSVEISPLLGEAFVTLATLTEEGEEKERLFVRAAAEGVNVDDDADGADEEMEE